MWIRKSFLNDLGLNALVREQVSSDGFSSSRAARTCIYIYIPCNNNIASLAHKSYVRKYTTVYNTYYNIVSMSIDKVVRVCVRVCMRERERERDGKKGENNTHTLFSENSHIVECHRSNYGRVFTSPATPRSP